MHNAEVALVLGSIHPPLHGTDDFAFHGQEMGVVNIDVSGICIMCDSRGHSLVAYFFHVDGTVLDTIPLEGIQKIAIRRKDIQSPFPGFNKTHERKAMFVRYGIETATLGVSSTLTFRADKSFGSRECIESIPFFLIYKLIQNVCYI